MKKTITLTLILLCIITLGAVCVQFVKAQSLSHIAINAEGSVFPSTAPIAQADDLYTLTSNFYGSISVQRSNITIDGNKYIAGSVSLYKVSNVK